MTLIRNLLRTDRPMLLDQRSYLDLAATSADTNVDAGVLALAEQHAERRAAARIATATLAADAARETIDTTSKVAVIPLTGVITPHGFRWDVTPGLTEFRAKLITALRDPEVSSIVLDVDSPGGLVDLVPETAELVRSARDVKPIVAISNTQACSAAYWIASQATEFIASPSSSTGSIGVYAVHNDWSGWNETMGVIPTYVFAAPFKVEGNPDEPLEGDARARWQYEVDAIYADFVAGVAAGRGVPEDVVRDEFGQGRALNARDALQAGLVDSIGTFDDAVFTAITHPAAAGSTPVAAAHPVIAARAVASASSPDNDLDDALAPTDSDKEDDVEDEGVASDVDPDVDPGPDAPSLDARAVALTFGLLNS